MINQSEKSATLVNQLTDLNKSFNRDEKIGWLNDLREANFERFAKLGIPSVKDEEWKYTNVEPIAGHTYNFSSNSTLEEKEAYKRYINQNEINIVFVNGIYSDELSNTNGLPQGVKLLTLENALKTEEDSIKKLLAKYKTNDQTSFIALNTAFVSNGIYIAVDKNIVTDKMIHLIHVTSTSNGEALSFPRTLISLEQSSEITILESHVAFSDEITYFANALTDVFLAENAVLHYTKAQKESLKAYHIGNTRVWQERNSNFDSFSYMSGALITRNNLDIVLNGEGCNANLNALYSNFKNQHVDNHTSVEHAHPNCTSNQLYKGLLNDSARAVFNGKIFVRAIAQLTNSYQLNKNLLLGDDCRVDTKPQLEIFADDVKCTHGATIGQLEEDELFYLQSRCIGRRAAIKILSRGFADHCLNEIKSKSIKDKLHILLEPSFAAL